MLEVAVIADDLTGAADTGVQFCPCYGHAMLVGHDRLLADWGQAAVRVLTVYTDSRSVEPELAAKRVRFVADHVMGLRPRFVYKKVDSCLRGNLGAEVEALMEEMEFEVSFIAPAFPAMGRTTSNDIHRLDDVPIAKTELAEDPRNPMRESQLSRIMAAQSRQPIGHVDLRVMEGDDNQLFSEITRFVEEGRRHMVFDVTRQVHLDRVVRCAVTYPKKVLLVGSAGLAQSLRNQIPQSSSEETRGSEEHLKGYHLVVVGTKAKKTHAQIDALARSYPYRVLSLEPGLLGDTTERESLLSKVPMARNLLSKTNLMIKIHGATSSQERVPFPDQIMEGLGLFVAAILEGSRPASLFVSGGETAGAVVRAIGASGIQLTGEIIPGVVQGRLVGTALGEIPFITKAGGFGDEWTLSRVHDYLRRKGRGDRTCEI